MELCQGTRFNVHIVCAARQTKRPIDNIVYLDQTTPKTFPRSRDESLLPPFYVREDNDPSLHSRRENAARIVYRDVGHGSWKRCAEKTWRISSSWYYRGCLMNLLPRGYLRLACTSQFVSSQGTVVDQGIFARVLGSGVEGPVSSTR